VWPQLDPRKWSFDIDLVSNNGGKAIISQMELAVNLLYWLFY
tara:strand:+ start:172 stop:297 length:126 start_codon:yes stop_codon:yes gene_type:complete